MRTIIACSFLFVSLASASAAADTLTVSPATAHLGDPVVVTVRGAKEIPKGTANGKPLQFFATAGGYQAVFAIPLDAKLAPITVEVDGVARPQTVEVREVVFPVSSVIVEEEYANPPAADRERIDADNAAILGAAAKAEGTPQFTRAFRQPPGEITSRFGVWRTFNDGHRSQHLGLDVFAREGAKVKAVNAGTVVLVRDCFLSGNVVVVAHGGGIASMYFHLSKTSVAEGDTVAQGDDLGLAGHTGRTTGPHLHVSIHVPGGMVDPLAFFKLRLAPVASKVTNR